MKKVILFFCIILLASACNNSNEDKARERLNLARAALEREDYNEAKLQIDSIKILYPKVYKVRKAGQDLLCIVIIKEQQHNLRYLTSMLQTKQQEYEAIKGQYVLEKNAKYQDVGNYFWRTQAGNPNRNFLRFQVNEQGLMTMTSFYHGSAINHRSIKVIASDGTYAETPATDNLFISNYLGKRTERADFHLGEDGGVINFLYLNINKSIRIIFKGKGNYATGFSSADRKALNNIYSLTRILDSIQKIKQDIEEANVKIKFILKKQKYESIHNIDPATN